MNKDMVTLFLVIILNKSVSNKTISTQIISKGVIKPFSLDMIDKKKQKKDAKTKKAFLRDATVILAFR